VSVTLINVDCNLCVSTTSEAISRSLAANSNSSCSRNFRSASFCEIDSSEFDIKLIRVCSSNLSVNRSAFDIR
jgi:hypothetical protein